MATLLQRLGLVTGLGLAGMVGSGCDRTVETVRYGEPPSVCSQEGRDHFSELEDTNVVTRIMGLPVAVQTVKTVKIEYNCNQENYWRM